jgi:hypothetical protein
MKQKQTNDNEKQMMEWGHKKRLKTQMFSDMLDMYDKKKTSPEVPKYYSQKKPV